MLIYRTLTMLLTRVHGRTQNSVGLGGIVQNFVFSRLVTELCVLRTFGGPDFSLIFICPQYVPEFLRDRLRASIQFNVMPKRAQYARVSGEDENCIYGGVSRPAPHFCTGQKYSRLVEGATPGVGFAWGMANSLRNSERPADHLIFCGVHM